MSHTNYDGGGKEEDDSSFSRSKRILSIPSIGNPTVTILTFLSSTRDSLTAIVVSISQKMPLRNRQKHCITDSASEDSSLCTAEKEKYLWRLIKNEFMKFKIMLINHDSPHEAIPRTITCSNSSSITKWCNDFKLSYVYVYKNKKNKNKIEKNSEETRTSEDEQLQILPPPNDDYLSSLAFLANIPDNELKCSYSEEKDNDDDYSDRKSVV